MELKEIVLRRRTEKSMSQRQLAKLVSVDFTMISKIENGEYVPSENVIVKLARALDVNRHDLILSANRIPSDFAIEIKSNPDLQDTLKKLVASYPIPNI
ncbi:multiprotein-bridging factor 1 family protein [Paenibacillus sp. UASWS1643]|uniref:helix-turn-helix domain-containing protein n=1 Tax=Paenibacillus sp. UASWS1643 TaxID=2580422 RepID=UPI001238C64E|nr:helix-turn-helix transcriptional regulator [Paenibacillus sp. UASWS1643]KAA8747135.1 helix-turn-helix transcriptional regulator [Paenibacillus sp. UASWS1643]